MTRSATWPSSVNASPPSPLRVASSDLVTADLDELEASLRGTVDDLTAADDERRRLLAALATNAALVEQLRSVEIDVRTLAERCRDRIADPPNLAVPSVDALGPAPDIDALPWPRASSMIQTRARSDRPGATGAAGGP